MNQMDIIKLFPSDKFYEDLLQPTAQEIGDISHNVVKAARFILAPIDIIAAYQDRFKRYLLRVAEKTESSELSPAPPELAGKVFEGMRYLPEESPLTEMFINLLATSIEKDKAHLAHPSFPEILRNLCRDEALMLYLCKTVPYFLARGFIGKKRQREFHNPASYFMYLEHISSLGLCNVERKRRFTINQDHSDLDDFNSRKEYFLSEMGKLFVEACIRDDMNLDGFHLGSDPE